MTGVTVIAEHTVKNSDKAGALLTCVIAAFVVIASVCIVAISIQDYKKVGGCGNIIFACFFSAIAILDFLLCSFAIKDLFDNSTHTEYTVILDESASYLEFKEKYKVLSEEDGVYRVMLVQEDE